MDVALLQEARLPFGTFISRLVIYGVARAVQRSKGVDVDKRFAEIPIE